MKRAIPYLPLLALVLAVSCSGENGAEQSSDAGNKEAASGAASGSDADVKKRLASLPPPYNTADFANGEARFGQCRACHSLTEGGTDGIGPNLHGVFGRPIGSRPSYAYSATLTKAGGDWTAERLDAYLTDPGKYLPGTKMMIPGIADKDSRRDLIVYLNLEGTPAITK